MRYAWMILLALSLTGCSMFMEEQSLDGTWEGSGSSGGEALRLSLDVRDQHTELGGTGVLEQGTVVDTVDLAGELYGHQRVRIHLRRDSLNSDTTDFTYEGQIDWRTEEISGQLTGPPGTVPMTLKRTEP